MDPALAFDLDAMLDEDTGLPLQESLFSNLNNSATLAADGDSIVGRYDATRGPAQKLVAIPPLYITANGQLVLDTDELLELFDDGTF